MTHSISSCKQLDYLPGLKDSLNSLFTCIDFPKNYFTVSQCHSSVKVHVLMQPNQSPVHRNVGTRGGERRTERKVKGDIQKV